MSSTTIVGTSGDDTYDATTGNYVISTNGGNDTLIASSATFAIDGLDVLIGTPDAGFARILNWFTPGTTDNQLASVEVGGTTYSRDYINNLLLTVQAPAGDDTIYGVVGYNNTIYANNDGDYIDVSTTAPGITNTNYIYGGSGGDTVYGGTSNDFIYGGSGDSYIDGGGGVDYISGGSGNDFIQDEGQNSYLSGGTGNSYLLDYGTNDTVVGGSGNDTLDLEGSGGSAYGGTGNAVFIQAGTGYTMESGGGNDTFIDLTGTATIIWADGDGTDQVTESSVGTQVLMSANTVTATRVNNDLVVSGDDGSIQLDGWFNGGAVATIVTPDGTSWSPDAINSNFTPGVYEVDYSTGIEDASGTVLSNALPSLSSFYNQNGTDWEGNDTLASNVADAAVANVVFAGSTVAGDLYQGSLAGSYTEVSAEPQGPSDGAVDYYATCTYSVQFDLWNDVNGSEMAITSLVWTVSAGEQVWETDPNTGQQTLVNVVQTTGSGSESAQRQVTVITAPVDSFTLYSANSPAAASMASMSSGTTVESDSVASASSTTAAGDVATTAMQPGIAGLANWISTANSESAGSAPSWYNTAVQAGVSSDNLLAYLTNANGGSLAGSGAGTALLASNRNNVSLQQVG